MSTSAQGWAKPTLGITKHAAAQAHSRFSERFRRERYPGEDIQDWLTRLALEALAVGAVDPRGGRRYAGIRWIIGGSPLKLITVMHDPDG